LWVLPLQSFSPDERSLPLSELACFHVVDPPGFPRDPLVDPTSKLSSLSSSPLTADGFTHTTGALLSWGYAFLRFSPSSPGHSVTSGNSFALHASWVLSKGTVL
jgi:hypothetical protein